MPFTVGIKEYRIWLAANQKCLVVKTDGTKGKVSNRSQLKVTCAGEGVEDLTVEKGASKLQLFIFVVSTCTQLVTCLTIKTRQSIV